MPFEMTTYVQSCSGGGDVGGGYAGWASDKNYLVMAYDVSTGKWATLPPYRAWNFAMTAINNHLVLVGGNECGAGRSRVLGVWDADKWTHPYPSMNTARTSCSAGVYHEWLIVAGGNSAVDGVLSTVEVMNTDFKQWYSGPLIHVQQFGRKKLCHCSP